MRAQAISICLAFGLTLSMGVSMSGATTYVGSEAFDGATANLSITTDGLTGVLSTSDITGFDLVISDALGSVNLTDTNSQVQVLGSALSADGSNLNFDFGADGFNIIIFELGTVGDDGPAYCASTPIDVGSCLGESVPSIILTTQEGEFPTESLPESGVVTLGTAVSGAPEPSAWALMLAGVGSIGLILRRRHRAAPSSSMTFAA